MGTIDEKRVYGDRSGATEAYVACGVGVVRVSVSGDSVGEFGLRERCDARDVAATDGAIAVATDEDVLVRAPGDDSDAVFEPTAFGPAVSVGWAEGDLLAAGPDGRVARLDRGASGWNSLSVPEVLSVCAVDGDLVGTDAGVYRVRGDDLEHVGLTDVRDVSAAGIPLAATANGLYALGNGWIRSREGDFAVASADPASESGRLERAHAVAGREVYEHADGEWPARGEFEDRVVDVAYGEATYAVTEAGTFLAAETGRGEEGRDGDVEVEGWRSHPLGMRDVRAVAVPSLSRS